VSQQSDIPNSQDAGKSRVDRWRHLHPLSLLVDAIDGVKSGVSLIIALGIVLVRLDLPQWMLWALGAAVLLCTCVVVPVITYMTTTFRLHQGSVELRSGITVKTHNIIGYSHIHAISSDEPFYYKPFGVVRLNIASAGSAEADLKLKAVPIDLGRELEQLRRASGPQIATSVTDVTESAVLPVSEDVSESGERLYRASTRDILLYALTDMRFLAAFAALAGLLNNLRDVLSERVFDDIANKAEAYFAGGLALITVAVILLIVVVMMCSVANSMMQFYGFEVWRRQNDLLIIRGLLTRHRVTIPMSRIQSVGIHQSVIRRMLHLSSVTLALSASHGEDDDGDSTSISLLPVIRRTALIATLSSVLPQWDIPTPRIQHTARGLMRYLLMVPCLLTVSATAAVAVVASVQQQMIILLWALLPLVVGIIVCLLRWMRGRNEGFQLLDDQRIIVSGARGFALFWVVTRRSRVQSIQRSTTVIRQRRRVESLTMPLFVFSGESQLRFSVIQQGQAQFLQDWATRIPE
jgi:putative membrane protein